MIFYQGGQVVCHGVKAAEHNWRQIQVWADRINTGSPFQTREALLFPAAPYRPISIGLPLGRLARRSTYFDILGTLYHIFDHGQLYLFLAD